jgi:hypothetical protein
MDMQELLTIVRTSGMILMIIGILLLCHPLIIRKAEPLTKKSINRFGIVFTVLGILIQSIVYFMVNVK